ncbi:MFS transporter [Terasakiella pusilla]|uniref:MFS transporter n=1 Tax=Terasakiella pusilla TaxID=64973 RepID=UPI003AA9319F
MAIRISSVLAILFGTVFLSTGQGLHQALIPIAASAFQFDAVALSILASVYFAGYLGGCFTSPMLIKRVGHTRTLAIAASLLSALSLAHIIWPTEALWIVVRLFVGACFANIDVVLESWLADRAPPAERGKLLSFYRLCDLFALAMGQLMIAQASPTEFTLFAYVAILVSIAVIVVSVSVAPTPTLPEQVKVRFFQMAKRIPLSIVAASFHGVASGIYWGFAPIFAAGLSEDRTMTGFILAATLLGAALTQFPIGIASDKYDRRILLRVISMATAISALLVAFTSFFLKDVTIVAMFMYGATSFCIYPIAITYAFDRTQPSEFVEVGATVLIAYGIGAMVGPLLTPLALHFGNHSGAFVLMGVFYLMIFGFALYREKVREPVAAEETVQHMHVPNTTQITLEMDPRVETKPEPSMTPEKEA